MVDKFVVLYYKYFHTDQRAKISISSNQYKCLDILNIMNKAFTNKKYQWNIFLKLLNSKTPEPSLGSCSNTNQHQLAGFTGSLALKNRQRAHILTKQRLEDSKSKIGADYVGAWGLEPPLENATGG